jgi:multiple sugar transport system permease protein
MAKIIHLVERSLLLVFVIIFVVSALYPFLLMVVTSFKTEQAIWRAPSSLIPSEVSLVGYEKMLHELPFMRIYANTAYFAIGVTLLAFLLDSMAAYALIRVKVPGYGLFLLAIIGTMMVPFQVRMIPVYNLLSTLGWLDSFKGLMIPRAADAFGIFLFVQFFRTLPTELEDAAQIDGCTTFRTYWNIILPLCGPAIATFAVSIFIGNWNDLMWPLIIVHEKNKMVLQAALALFRGGAGDLSFYSRPHIVMAGGTLSMLPTILIFVLAQRYFVQSLALTGLKG